VEELVDEGGVGGLPSEFGASFGRTGALIEQEGFGEVVSMSWPTVEYTPLPMTW
jgi:hypothetical protein